MHGAYLSAGKSCQRHQVFGDNGIRFLWHGGGTTSRSKAYFGNFRLRQQQKILAHLANNARGHGQPIGKFDDVIPLIMPGHGRGIQIQSRRQIPADLGCPNSHRRQGSPGAA